MKIKSIETLVCHARMRNWVFVKVLTDQAIHSGKDGHLLIFKRPV